MSWVLNPAYTLRTLGDLPDAERVALLSLAADEDVFAVLQPSDTAHTVKALSRDTAELITTVMAGRRPRSPEALRAIAELEGMRVLLSDQPAPAGPPIESEHPLARLSWDAVSYAAQHAHAGQRVVADRLYAFGRLPASAMTATQDPLEWAWAAGWHRSVRDDDPWIRFSRPRNGRATAKLYVSPRPSDVRSAFQAVVQAADGAAVRGFKIGRLARDLARPDKLVVYVASIDAAREMAARLGPLLDDIPGHGVPMTAPLVAGALVSWGIDPPDGHSHAPSWRRYLAEHVASAITEGRDSSADARAAVAARLALIGVDPTTWTPRPDLWSTAVLR